jgi:hypothetical protein
MGKIFSIICLSAFTYFSDYQPRINDGSLQDVLDQYYTLGEALADSNGQKVKAALVKFSTVVEKTRYSQIISENKHIAKVESIAEIRKFYHKISLLLRRKIPFDESLEEPVFVINCRSINSDSSGIWLSDNKKIRNPYSTLSNASCGNIIEVVKPMVR